MQRHLRIERNIGEGKKWRWTAYLGPMVAATGFADSVSEATRIASKAWAEGR